MLEDLSISMVQSHIVWEDKENNLKHYEKLLRRVSGKTDIVVLPETFTTGFSMHVEQLADTMDGITIRAIKEWAKNYNFAIAGSFIAQEEDKFFNRSFFGYSFFPFPCLLFIFDIQYNFQSVHRLY